MGEMIGTWEVNLDEEIDFYCEESDDPNLLPRDLKFLWVWITTHLEEAGQAWAELEPGDKEWDQRFWRMRTLQDLRDQVFDEADLRSKRAREKANAAMTRWSQDVMGSKQRQSEGGA